MTIRQRFLYSDRGDHFSMRDASEPIYDQRDLDSEGNPPSWFLKHETVNKKADEVEFDHIPTEAELNAAFPNRSKPNEGVKE